MEDVIGFLILMVTLIISVVASVKKKSGQNKTMEQSFENTSKESSGEGQVLESSVSQTKDKAPASWEELMGYDEETGESEEADAEEIEEKEEMPSREEEYRAEPTIKDGDTEKTPYKETYRTKKRRTKSKSKIQEIKERFDVEEGIIYSEILNKKYF